MMLLAVAFATMTLSTAPCPVDPVDVVETVGRLVLEPSLQGKTSQWDNPLNEQDRMLYTLEPALKDVEGMVRREQWSRAAEAINKAKDKLKNPKLQPYVRFVQAVAMYQAGRYESAVYLFKELAGKVPELEDWARYYHGFALFNQEKFVSSHTVWTGFSDDFPLLSYVARYRCVALANATKRKEFLECAETFRSRHNDHPQLAVAEARVLIYFKRWKDAAERVKWVRIQHPTGTEGKEAAELEDRIQGAGHRSEVSLKWSEQLEQAKNYYDAHWYKMALSVTTQLMETLDKEGKKRGELWCHALGFRASTMARRRHHTKSIPYFHKFVSYCPEHLTPKALYRGCDAARKAGKHGHLRRWVDILVERFPESSLCDDSLVFLARAYDREGKPKQVEKTIQRLFGKFPKGDLAAEGAWMLVFSEYKAKKYKKVMKLADQFQKRLPERQNYKSDGRLLYWKGRSAQKTKQKKSAVEAYTEILKRYPLSWYGLLAYHRLDAMKKGQGASIMAELQQNSEAILPSRKAIEEQLELAPDGVKRGIVLLNLGLSAPAGYEFKEVLEKDSEEGLAKRLLAASLYDRVGFFTLSHHLMRRKASDFGYTYPTEKDLRWWKVAYPPAFLEVVREETGKTKIPWNLVIGIMREESGFDPRIESYAHAIGLMQLLQKTANWVADRKLSKSDLHDPRRNIKLGIGFLEYLHGKFGHPALMVAGYNSGAGGVFKTLKRYDGKEVDEFVEHIPYDQTRRYTKRVLSSAWRYQVLYGGEGVIPMKMRFER